MLGASYLKLEQWSDAEQALEAALENGASSSDVCEKAANFNALNSNYAYVRDDAQKLLAELQGSGAGP